MSATVTGFRRWLAASLLRRAHDVLPPSHRHWAAAMANELHFVEEGHTLAWALGCFWAGCVERLRTPEISPARLFLALAMLLPAANDTFATALTAAYRLNAARLAHGLGSFTPGDDYTRLIPLMNAVPLWLHGLWLLAATCYLAAIVRLLFRLPSPHVPVLIAVAVEIIAEQLSRPIVAAVGVAANPNPSIVAILLPVLFSLTLAAILWISDRNPSHTAT